MAREVDIAVSITARDNMSDALRKMQSNMTPLRKDLGELEKELDRLRQNKATLNADFVKASTELKNAKKDLANLGDEMSRQKYMEAQMNYDNIKSNLDLVSSGARQTAKDMQNLTTQMSKTDNRAGTMQMGKAGKGMLSSLGKAGLYDLVGQSVANAGQTYIASAFGSVAGNMSGNILSGLSSGVMMGSMVGGLPGAVIGGVVGTVAGTITGVMEKYKNEDEAFKGVVKSEYDRVKELQQTNLKTGSEIAANRELLRLSFETQIGDKDAAGSILDQAKEYADLTPYGYDEMIGAAKNFVTAGTPLNDVIKRMQQIGDLAQGQGDIYERVAWAYTKMTSKQKITLEELNMMTEAGIPILKELGKQYGVTGEDLFGMIRQGKIGIDDLNRGIDALTGEGGAFHGVSEKMSQTYPGLLSTKQDNETDLQAAMGEGYNDKRIEGLKKEINFMSGETGDKMKQANYYIGQWEANLENERERIYREHMEAAMNEIDKLEPMEKMRGVKAGEITAKARAAAEAEYRESEGYKLQIESDMALVDGIRNSANLRGAWRNFGYEMQLEFEKGRMSVPMSSHPLPPNTITPVGGIGVYQPGERSELPEPGTITPPKVQNDKGYPIIQGFGLIGGDAYGLPYVPYDNYAALLHQGERVLTAREARNYQDGGGVSINIGGMTVREEADIDRIAKTIVREIQYAKVGYGG